MQEPYEAPRAPLVLPGRGRRRRRLPLPRLVLRPFLEQVRDLDAAREAVDLRARPVRRRAHPPPVGLGPAGRAELVQPGQVRRHVLGLRRRAGRGHLPAAQAARSPLDGDRQAGVGGDRGGGRRALPGAEGVQDLLGRADPLQDAPYGGRGVRVVLGAPTVDLVPQPRHQPHPVTGGQLPLLRQVPDAAQIFVDQVVAFDPHAQAPPLPPVPKVARAPVELLRAQRIPLTGWGPAD